MNEIRITFPDVPGAAIVGDEEAVNDLLVKLTAGMDVAQLCRVISHAEYSRQDSDDSTPTVVCNLGINTEAVDAAIRKVEKLIEQLEKAGSLAGDPTLKESKPRITPGQTNCHETLVQEIQKRLIAHGLACLTANNDRL